LLVEYRAAADAVTTTGTLNAGIAAAAATCSGSAGAAVLTWLVHQANRTNAYDRVDIPATRKGAASSKITAPACQADTAIQQHSACQPGRYRTLPNRQIEGYDLVRC
jgi:hypothetical protein